MHERSTDRKWGRRAVFYIERVKSIHSSYDHGVIGDALWQRIGREPSSESFILIVEPVARSTVSVPRSHLALRGSVLCRLAQLPTPWQEFPDLACGCERQAFENITHVNVGIEVVKARGLYQGHDHGRSAARTIGAGK